jgi:cellobiose phosphorylase
MYRLIVESLLGLRLEVDKLHISPCLPAHWQGYKLHYRYRETVYHIAIVQTHSEVCLTVDGTVQEGFAISLVDDRQEHQVEVRVLAA